MSKESNIVHRYLRKKSENSTILLRINPMDNSGLKLILVPGKDPQLHSVEFEETLWEDLTSEGFQEGNPLEFNLYYAGLA